MASNIWYGCLTKKCIMYYLLLISNFTQVLEKLVPVCIGF